MDPDLVHIEKLRGGCDDALSELMTLYKDSIFRYVFRYVGNEADAAELTEETFVKVYFNAAKFRPKAKVKTWIFTIATNLCRDWHRSNRRRSLEVAVWVNEDGEARPLVESQPDDSPGVRDQAQVAELDDCLKAEIAKLPPKLREPFLLSVLEEKSHEETGELLGISSKAVETRVYRARKLLRETLDRYFRS